MSERAPAPARRRTFLGALAAGLGALAAAAGAVPLVGSLLSPLRRREEAEAGFVRVASLAGLPEGRPVRVAVVDERRDAWTRGPAVALGAAWLLRSGGQVRAFSATCPHLSCGVESDGKAFHCPCHGSAFDLSGAVRGGPAPRGLDPLEVRLGEGDAVLVRWRRFAAGTAERRPA